MKLNQSELQKCYTLSPAKLLNQNGFTMAAIMGFGCSDLPFPPFAGTAMSQIIGNPIGNCSAATSLDRSSLPPSVSGGGGCNSGCAGPYTKTLVSIVGSRTYKSGNQFYSTGSSFIKDESEIKNVCTPTIQGQFGFQGLSYYSIFPGNYNVEYFAIEFF